MFGKNDNQSNERIIYQTRPNLLFGCKKAILGFILLVILLSASGPIIQFIGKMQVYLISHISLPLTRYTAIAVFVLMIVIVVYIIWQIVGWYAKEYILTESKIIVKSGVLLNRKNYMPYATIQDINTSQSVFARLFNVGSISVFSAYDNNSMSLDSVSDPSKVEEIIFSNMTQSMNRFSYQPPRNPIERNVQPLNYEDDYDDVVITPITREEQYARRQYEYYPEDLSYGAPQRPRYEYEPYDESLEQNINRAMGGRYERPPNYGQNDYYNDVRHDYSCSNDDDYYEVRRNPSRGNGDDYYYEVRHDYSRGNDDDYYEVRHNPSYGNDNRYYDDEEEKHYDESPVQESDSRQDNVSESSEKIIKRHFDKFKR